MISKTAPHAPHQTAPNFQHHHSPNAALLIDFDNVTMGIRSDLGKELKSLLNSEVIRGKVAVQRAYADWRRYPQYIVPLAESSIDLIFAPAYGSSKKNATDLRMAIDAIELVFTRPEIGTYILMTGDSDFSSCVLKLKEYGKYVIGVGMRESSSDLLIQNCDEYYSYHSLSGLTRAGEVEESQEDPWVLVKRAAQQMVANGDVMRTDRLKQVMLELDPGFDEKKLGYSKFSRFVQEAGTKGFIRLRKGENGQYEIVADEEDGAARAAEPATLRDEPRRGRGRGDGRGRGRDREPREARGAPVEPARVETAVAEVVEASVPAPAEPPRVVAAPRQEEAPTTQAVAAGVPTLQDAYSLLQDAVRSLTSGANRSVRDGDVKRKMLATAPGFDETALGFSKFTRFLRQAHDAEAIDLKRANAGNYEVSLPASGKRLPPPKGEFTGPPASATAAAEPEARPAAPRAERTPERTESRPAEPAAAAAPTVAPSAPAPSPAPAPRAAAPAPVGALRGRRGGRSGLAEGPPPILPGQGVPVARAAAPAEATRAEPAPEAADAASAEERTGTGRSRRGRRGGKGRSTEAAASASEQPAAESAPVAPVEEPAAEAAAKPAKRARKSARKTASKTAAKTASKTAAKKAAPGFDARALGLPEGRDEVVSYITGSYRGVGQKTAETLVDELGADVFRTMEEDPDRLRDLVGKGRATTLLNQWSTDVERRRAERAPAAETAPAESAPEASTTRAKSRGRRGGRGRAKKPASGA